MHTTAIYLCIHSLGSLHMSLVLTVDDLATVRKWHLFNQTANEAYLQLEMKQESPCLKKVQHYKGRIRQHRREIEEVDYHMDKRAKWDDEVRSKRLQA